MRNPLMTPIPHSRRWLAAGLAGLLSALALPIALRAQAPGNPDLPRLESSLADWLKLRSLIARESADWQEQQARLKREIELLEKENTALDAERAEHRRRVEAGARDDSALLRQATEARAELNALTEVAGGVGDRLVVLRGSVPPGLEERLPPSPETGDARAALAARIETLAAWENLAREAHAARAVIAPGGGERREAEILHLGTAQGLAVSLDGRQAWLGRATPTGWTWTELPGQAEAVRVALRIVRKEKPPVLTPLPLQPLGGGATP